ncbi:MAG: histidine phosphatase family protein [Rhizobiaceae bacterium]
MMKRLYIIRHAKSSWAQPGSSDIDRSLNDRGNEQVKLLDAWMQRYDSKIERVICSPARRTQETLLGIRGNFSNASISFIDDLYNGEMDTYLFHLMEHKADRVVIIGHNPTCDELTRYLTSPSSPAAEKLMANHFGTGTIAVLDFDGTCWREIGKSSCQLVDLISPKELEQV